jgi:hypothetical protein
MDPRDSDLTTLLHDAVADVEPADRLTEIRATTEPRPRRFGWYAAGGTALAVAASVTAFSLLSSPSTERANDVDPGAPQSSIIDSATPGLGSHPIYYLGDTAFGVRLFREFQRLAGPTGGVPAGAFDVARPPLDPDYRTFWTQGSVQQARTEGRGDDAVIEVWLTDEDGPTRPDGMTEEEARLSIQQMVYTLHAEGRDRLPVRFVHDGKPVSQVFGIEVEDLILNEPQLDVLSQVSISNPSDGRVVDGSFSADGVASSFEGNVPWTLSDADGTNVRSGFATAAMEEHLVEWRTGPIDVSDLPPGTYTFLARTDAQQPFVDTRTVVVE